MRREDDDAGSEANTQWVKAQNSRFSSPSTPPSGSLSKVRESLLTSDGGLILVRELDERPGIGELILQHLTDSRRGKNTQFPFVDLLPQSVCSRPAGYEDPNDAERISQDPTFRLTGSEKICDRGAALTSRLQTFESVNLKRPSVALNSFEVIANSRNSEPFSAGSPFHNV